ncbi:MAG: XTP/dITP diphosphatase [Candidatus Omnitrophota bacterium]
MKKEIVIATKNEKKFKELKRFFHSSRIKVLSLKEFPQVPEVVEDGETFGDNAIKKALAASRHTDKIVLADDSGLEVNALDMRPGVHSARYAGPGKTDDRNMEKLLKALKGIDPKRRTARFRCVIAIARERRVLKLVEGVCEGRIGFVKEGATGFGYDPVFIPRGRKKTFAQLGSREKDRLSHRGKALRKAKGFIQRYLLKGL